MQTTLSTSHHAPPPPFIEPPGDEDGFPLPDHGPDGWDGPAAHRPARPVAIPPREREAAPDVPLEDWKVVALLGGTALGGLATFVLGAVGISALL